MNQSVEVVDAVQMMEQWFRIYTQYTIEDKGIPQIQDGLTLGEQRIIWTMLDPGMGFQFDVKGDSTYLALSVVGSVVGNYHPVGDVAVYHTLAAMVQDYANPLPCFLPQGQYGSIDAPDAIAAPRYPIVGVRPTFKHMFRPPSRDIEDAWKLNFKDTILEPDYIDSALPLCLITGKKGIAISLASTIPAYNPGEIIDALLDHLLNDIPLEESVRNHVKGPDYAWGGEVYAEGDTLTSPRGRLHNYPSMEVSGRIIKAYNLRPQTLYTSLANIRLFCAKRGIAVTVEEYDLEVQVVVQSVADIPTVEGVVRSCLSFTGGYDFTLLVKGIPQRVNGVIEFLQLFLMLKTPEELADLPSRLQTLRPFCAPRSTVILDQAKQLRSISSSAPVDVQEYLLHLSDLHKLKLTKPGTAWKLPASSVDYVAMSQTVTSETTLPFLSKGKVIRKRVKDLLMELNAGMVFPFNKGGVVLDAFMHPCVVCHATDGVYKGTATESDIIRRYVIPNKEWVIVVWESASGLHYYLSDRKTFSIPGIGRNAVKLISPITLDMEVVCVNRATRKPVTFTARTLQKHIASVLPRTQGETFSTVNLQAG